MWAVFSRTRTPMTVSRTASCDVINQAVARDSPILAANRVRASFAAGRKAMTRTGANSSSSISATSAPAGDRKAVPIGATGIGRHGAKYLVGSIGQNNAHPSPPLVIVSSNGWVARTPVAKRAVLAADRLKARAARPMANPASRASAKECVAPRCPHGCAYSMPNANPTTSMSGSRDSADQQSTDDHRHARLVSYAPCRD